MDFIRLAVGQSVQADSGNWYRNLQLLGTGGNAVTFLTVATSGPNRGILFAIKLFRKRSKPERRESFLQEIQFLKQSSHPAIMRVYDTGTFQRDYPFLVAEYLPNTLFNLIRAGQTSVVAKISFSLQLLSSLVYLETLDRPVVHRDIKPRNIFVKGQSCVLGDFGLLKHVDAEDGDDRHDFKESIGAGMPFRYRTPDQVAYLNDGTPLTTRSDVFQLGLVLCELFTGSNPEKNAEDFTTPVEIAPLPRFPGALGAGLANVVARMLEKDWKIRDSALRLLPAWEGIFKSAVERAHAIEGRAIW